MTDLLTPSALLEIEERAGKATAGEWHVDGFHTSAVIHEEKPRIFNRICETDSEHFPNANWRHDAAFIAHARTDIPALLAHISRTSGSAGREEKLEAALRTCLIGGNHIASQLIHRLGPNFSERFPPNTDSSAVLEALGATTEYDMWCSWAACMRARDTLEQKP